MPSLCPTEAELTALLIGKLPEAECTALERHLEGCAACRQRLDFMAVGDGNWLGGARAHIKAGSPIPARVPVERPPSNVGATTEIKVLPPDPLLASGEGLRRLGDYEILGELGRGGMGVVFKARQQSLQRDVALKVILAGQLASATQIRRFHVEAEAAAKLDHPNIVPIYEIGEQEGRHYFSMKLIDGSSLKERRAEFRALQLDAGSTSGEIIQRERKLARLMAAITRAVHHAHQRGILHRDLKPGNVLLDAQGQPHLTDFGLAKLLQAESDLTVSRMVVGTPEYMSPEQASGQARMITTASDVYGLGAILYELLAGRPPFTDDDVMSVLNQVAHNEPKPARTLNPSVSRDLETICLKCLEKEPARRYHSAEALADDLERFERGEPIRSRPVSTAERVWRWCRRKPALAGALAGLILVSILGFIVVAWSWRGEARQRQVAQREGERAQEALTNLEIEKSLQAANPSWGLAALARLLRQQPTNQIVAERLMNALSYRSFSLPVAPLRHGKALNFPEASRERQGLTAFVSESKATISAANFGPDGRHLVTASLDGTACIWDTQDGHRVGDPLRHDGGVLWAQFSPDGTKLVTASSDGTARIWDVGTQQLIAALPHRDAVRYANFSPDGTRVVTACNDGKARIWNVAEANSSALILPHTSPVYYADFSPDGRRLLTAEELRHSPAHVWDASTGEEIGEGFPHHPRPEIRNPFPRFSPSGDWVLVFDRFNGFVFPSDPASAERPEQEHKLHHDNDVIALAFSPDGQFVATGSHDATARIWSTTNIGRALLTMLHMQSVNSVQFGSEGRTLLTGSNDRTARLWDKDTGRALTEPLRHETSVLNALVQSNRIVTISESECAWLWDVPLGKPPVVSLPEPAGVEYVRFSPDGNTLASLNHQGVSLWDVRTRQRKGRAPLLPQNQQRIFDFDFSPTTNLLATALENGNTIVWNLSSLRPNGLPRRHSTYGLQREQRFSIVRRVRFSRDGKRMVTAADDGVVCVWAVGSGTPIFGTNLLRRANYAEFDATGDRIVVACWDNTAHVYDGSSGKPLFDPLRHENEVHWARFDPSGKFIITASRDKTVRVWFAQTGELFRTLVHADALAESHSFDFADDGSSQHLATIAGDSLQVWDLNTGQSVWGPIRHNAALLSVRFSRDGKRLVTAANDGDARLWDAHTGHQLSEPFRHEGQATYAEFSPDGRVVGSGSSSDDRVCLWPVVHAPLPTPDWLPELAEALAGQQIREDDVSGVVAVLSLFQLRQKLLTNSQPDHYSRWARWFFANDHSKESSSLFTWVTGD